MEIKIELSNNLKSKPSENELQFGKYFTDHMFVMDYTDEKGWHNPCIMPYSPLMLEPAAMVLHYGQAVFEGMKCYRKSDGKLLLFRPEKNFERLNASDERLCIPHIDESFALKALMELLKIEKDWVPSAKNTSLYIRPFTIATDFGLGVHASNSYKFLIILSPVGLYYAEGLNPVKICIEGEYVRAVRGGIGFTKATANYASSLKGQMEAKKKGYAQVLWLDGVERKYIEEVGTMNIFFVIDGEVITPSLEGSILPGVTRNSVLELTKSWGMKVTERRISIQELYEAFENGRLEEAFGTGTAAVISPISEFNWCGESIVLSGGNIGPIAQKLYDQLTGIQYGKLEDEFGWVREVV